MSTALRLMFSAICVLLVQASHAQYPSKPVRFIAPFPAGGPTDSVARIVGVELSRRLGQPVLIDNRPGAEGAIAAQAVKAAAPDGYTMFFASTGVLVLPFTTKPAAFDTVADFAPVATVGTFPFAIYVHPSLPSRSLKDFVAYARAHPGKLAYGSINVGQQMAAEQFMKATGVSMTRIPYRGVPQLMPDLVEGRVHANFGPLGGGLAYAKEGRIRILATLSQARTPATPDVPTVGEAGFPAVSADSYQLLLAPAGTPKDIVERLAAEIRETVATPEVRTRLEQLPLVIDWMGPERLASMLAESNRTWSQFFRDNSPSQ